MLKMSFYNGTLNRKQLLAVIETTDKPIVYSYGLGYRHPTTYRKPITKEEAVIIVNRESLLDATEEGHAIHLNAFSSNDLW